MSNRVESKRGFQRWSRVAIGGLALGCAFGCQSKSTPEASASSLDESPTGSDGKGRAKGEEGNLKPASPPAVAAQSAPSPMATTTPQAAPVDDLAALADEPAKQKGGSPRPVAVPGQGYGSGGLGLRGAGAGGGGKGVSLGGVGHGPRSAPVAEDAPPPAPEPVQKLDPNARYATTYRPGGAALAAFDAAVSRGSIPVVYKDLVGDFGGRYAPKMDPPKDTALSFRVETERTKIAPGGGFLNLRVAMRSSDVSAGRAPLSVHLVLDVSGSMEGKAIEHARSAAEELVKKLDPQDDFSLVTFSDEAKVLVPDGVVGPRREQIIAKIHHIVSDGGTNISAGLDAGYAEAHKPGINPDAVRVVMFLSDGHANAGDTNATRIAERSAKAFQDGIQTSAFGLGTDFDGQIMAKVADEGAGGYYYLADASQIAPALGRELDARLQPVAQAVEVRLRLRPDVVPLKVYGSRVLSIEEAARVRTQEVVVDKQVAKHDNIKRDRQEDAVGGMRFFMPAFAKDDRHAMLITVMVPPGTDERTIASVEVKYKDRIRKKNATEEIAVKVGYATSDAESFQTTNQSVVGTVQAFAAGDAILFAAERTERGDRKVASAMLLERALLLKRAGEMLEDPALGEDAMRIARLATAVNGSAQVQDSLPLAIMLRGSGYGYLR